MLTRYFNITIIFSLSRTFLDTYTLLAVKQEKFLDDFDKVPAEN